MLGQCWALLRNKAAATLCYQPPAAPACSNRLLAGRSTTSQRGGSAARTPRCTQVGVLNVAGFFDHLLAFLDHAAEQGFIRPQSRAIVVSETSPAALLDALEAYTGAPGCAAAGSLLRSCVTLLHAGRGPRMLHCMAPDAEAGMTDLTSTALLPSTLQRLPR